MKITPESKFARLQILRHTFSRLTEFYQRKGEAIAWAVDCSPDSLWAKGPYRNNMVLLPEAPYAQTIVLDAERDPIYGGDDQGFEVKSFRTNDPTLILTGATAKIWSAHFISRLPS